MIVNAQKQVYALESTVEGLNGRTERTVKHAVALKKHNEIRRVVKDVVLPEFSKQQVLKIAEQVIQEAENTILYAKYLYDLNDVLVNRTKFVYDDKDNLIEYREEMINDGSRYWMQWSDSWIPVYRYTLVFDNLNNLTRYKEWKIDYENGEFRLVVDNTTTFDEMSREIYHESYSWDDNRQMLRGVEKLEQQYDARGYVVFQERYVWDDNRWNWVGEYKEIREIDDNNGITNMEQYAWDFDGNRWFGQQKYTSTYVVDGNNTQEEQFFWYWDINAQIWIKDTSFKYQYTYEIINQRYWYELRNARYDWVDTDYVLVNEVTRVPYPQGNSYLSSLRRINIDGVMTNFSKMEYQYNENNKWTQVVTSVWIADNWEESEFRLYTYTTPDSLRTQTNLRTSIYYQFNNITPPDLCQGQTYYPVSKISTKYHPVTGNQEVYYAYRWEQGLCNWVPNSSKVLDVYDETGEYNLSHTECHEFDQNDWYNCYNRQMVYNEAGQKLEDSEYQDGVLMRKVVNIYDEQGLRIENQVYNGENIDYTYEFNYSDNGKLIRQIFNRTNNQLPLGRMRYKWEVEYIADTLISVITGYRGVDLNSDGILQDDEWSYDGKEVYKYDAPISGDSVHIQTNAYGDIELLDFGNVKKIKISGPVKNEELAYLHYACRDSLRLLDLEAALVEENALKTGVFDETRINTLILPSTLQKIEQEAIVDYEGYLEELIVYPSVIEFEYGAIEALGLKRLEIKSELFDMLYSFVEAEIDLPGIINIYRSKLEKITFNDTHGKLANEICYDLAYLKEVIIRDGLTEIGDNAFKSCGMLKLVKLPATLTKIGYNAFWGCNELAEIIIPEGTTEVGHSAFWGCSGVASIEMPSTLQTIGKNAFWGCTSVEKMQVSAVEPPVLGDNALAGVPRDAALTIPEISVETYKSRPQWGEFYKINTGTDDNPLKSVRMIVTNKKLSLYDIPQDTTLQLFNISGLKVLDVQNPDEYITIELEPGVYVVKIGNGLSKIIVR
jgi:hypothetical protein